MDFIRLAEKKLNFMRECLSTEGGVALYPFGMEAKAVKSLLEVQYDIKPVLLLDNFLCREYPDKICGLDVLCKPQYHDVTVLVVSDLVTVHEELLEQLYAVHPKEKCIDLLEESYDELTAAEKDNSLEILQATMDKVQSAGMLKNGMIYHPEKTHANICLPFALTDLIQRSVLMTDDYYERELLTKVFTFKNSCIAKAVKDHVVLDLGANIGNHSLYFTLEAGARKVVACEPVPLTFSILQHNVELNQLEDRIDLYNCGLGKKDSHAMVPSYHVQNIGGTAIRPGKNGSIIVRRLDEMELPADIALIKIDVEGM